MDNDDIDDGCWWRRVNERGGVDTSEVGGGWGGGGGGGAGGWRGWGGGGGALYNLPLRSACDDVVPLIIALSAIC